jgi:hypothetical protein
LLANRPGSEKKQNSPIHSIMHRLRLAHNVAHVVLADITISIRIDAMAQGGKIAS